MHIAMIHKSWILSVQPSIPTRCSCESVQLRLPAAVRTNRLPASSELTLSTQSPVCRAKLTHEFRSAKLSAKLGETPAK